MSIELCQSSTSSSLIWANTPRLDASLTKPGSGARWPALLDGRRRQQTAATMPTRSNGCARSRRSETNSHPATGLTAKRGEAHSPRTLRNEKDRDDRLDHGGKFRFVVSQI